MAAGLGLPSYLFNVDYVAIMNRVEARVRGRVRRGVMAMFTDYAMDGVLGDIIADLRAGTFSPVTLYQSLDILLGQSELMSEPVRQALDEAGLSVMRIASRDVGAALVTWAERSSSIATRADVRFDPTDPSLLAEMRRSGDLFWDSLLRDTIRGIKSEVERSYFNNDSPSVMADRLEMVAGLTPDQTESLDRIRRTMSKGPLQPAQRDKVIRETADKMRAMRAERITRTELNRIVNSGAVSYWQQMARRGALDYNTTLMEWNTHPDERACPVCAPLDGVATVVGGQFAPGVLMPPVHPNCRCSLELKYKIAPVIDIQKRDGDGDGLESRGGSADIFPVVGVKRIVPHSPKRASAEDHARASQALRPSGKTLREFSEREDYPGVDLPDKYSDAVSRVFGEWMSVSSVPSLRTLATQMRERGSDYIAGVARNGPDGFSDTRMARVLASIDMAPKTVVWRGMRVTPDVAKKLTTVGGVYSESLSTATGRESLARDFADGVFGKLQGSGDVPVLIRMSARNVPVIADRGKSNPLYANADERFISGDFRVVRVVQPKKAGDPIIVEVDQV